MSDYLPLDELVEVLGEADAVKLVAAFGGTRIYVGPRVRSGNKILAVIGADAWSKLSGHLGTGRGGLWVELPRGPSGQMAEYRRRLLEAAASPDQSEAAIAQRLRVHGRTVRRARAKLRQDERSPQRRLF